MSPSRSHTPHISSTRGGVCGLLQVWRDQRTNPWERHKAEHLGPAGTFQLPTCPEVRVGQNALLITHSLIAHPFINPGPRPRQGRVPRPLRPHLLARRGEESLRLERVAGHLRPSRVISGYLGSSRIDLPRGRNLVSMRSQSRPRGCSGSGAFCHKDVMFGTSHRSSAAGSCSGTSTEPSGRRRPRANQVINSSTAVQPSKSRRPSV